MKNIEDEVKHEAAILVKDIYDKAKEEANRKAKEVLATAIQKCAPTMSLKSLFRLCPAE